MAKQEGVATQVATTRRDEWQELRTAIELSQYTAVPYLAALDIYRRTELALGRGERFSISTGCSAEANVGRRAR